MRDLAGADQAETLDNTAGDEHPSQQIDDRNRSNQRIHKGKQARDNHQNALKKIPERMPLDGLAHRFAHHLGSGF
jgi:hypothetical protein